ncbi:ATP-binding protein [Burkholderia cenocepacia]|uniref:ATP-binding protein n=1 Tax=Burkholderia cenocepacia TaxID=95486 RepID=UPI0028619814|nr:transporter substrate-binding domain-containing protein [Burkholderia cenocepacia]MDR8050301.1 transporter substrate-binding domain-containing protein [Burkholderia cenocepacia]
MTGYSFGRLLIGGISIGLRCRRHVVRDALLVALSLIAVQSTRAAELPAPVARKSIVVGTLSGDKRMPFERVGSTGKLEGFSGEYLRLLLRKAPGVGIVTRPFDDIPSLIQAACSGQVDLVTSIDVTLNRARCLVYSAPYLRDNAAFLGRIDDRRVANDDRLRGARIGVTLGSVYLAELHTRYPNSTIVPLRAENIVSAVRQRRVDVFFGTSAVLDYALARFGDGHDLGVIRRVPDTRVQLHFAAGMTNADLIHWLDARQIEVSNGAMQDLMDRWFGMHVGSPVRSPNIQLALTEDDRRYLRSLPALKIGFGPEWSPITYLGPDGQFQGLASDYLDYLERTLGIRFERPPLEHWPAILDEFGHGNLDLIVGARNSVIPGQAVVRSEPIDTFPLVAVLPKATPTVASMRDLRGKRIGVLNGRIEDRPADELVRGANIVSVTSDVEGYDWLAGGKIDAYVSNIAIADLMIATRYSGQLRTSIPIGRQQDVVLIMQAKYARLNELIDRSLAALHESDRMRARNKWLTPRYNYGVSWSDVIQRLLPVALGAVGMFALVLVAYLRQRAEARRRARAENLLETQLSIQRTLMETLPYPVMAVGSNGRLLLVNNAAVEMLGGEPDAIRGQDIEDVSRRFPIVRRLFAAREKASRMNSSVLRELAYIDRNGAQRTMLCRAAPFRESHDSRGGVIAALVDVTDTRLAQEREAEAAQRLSELTRGIPAVVFQVYRPSGGELSFSFVGGNAALLFGISAECIVEREENLLARVLPEDRASLMAEVDRSARTLEPANVAFRTQVNGNVLWIRGKATPVLLPDGGVQWSGYWVDTTAERQQADALRAARDLALKASNAKDEFLAMMSHEIRTPMNGVLGLVELLGETSLDHRQAHMLGLIQGSASTLLQVLDDILDYSKIEAGQLALEPTSVDIRRLCDSVLGLLAGRAREKGVLLRVVVDAQVGTRLRVDGVRLRQILFNLIGNAIKFTEHGSVTLSISVAMEIAGSGVSGATQVVVCRVEDTGIGIAQDQQAAIFAPFSQADRSITRRFGGTGLGLTICSKLVRMMGGDIVLSSKQGQGTTVKVTLRMPIEHHDASMYPLTGKRVGVRLPEHEVVSEGLRQYVLALGGTVVDDEHVDLDLDLVSENFANTCSMKGTVVVTDNFELCSTWDERDTVFVCANPLLFGALEYVCAKALRQSAPESLPPPGDGVAFRRRAVSANRKGEQRVLLAEDNPINREVMVSQLHALGFECDVAMDGNEALQMLDAYDYAILLTDCHMPFLDGFQLAKTVRAREAGTERRLPVIGVTASTLVRDRQHCITSGMDACLTKPVGLAELGACLDTWLPPGAARPGRDDCRREPGPVLDRLDIAELRALYPLREDFNAFVQLFIKQLSLDLEALRRLGGGGNLNALREQMHRVAGSLSVLGLQEWQAEIAGTRQALGTMTSADREACIVNMLDRGQRLVMALELRLDEGEQEDC